MAGELLHREDVLPGIQERRYEAAAKVMGREWLCPGLLLSPPEDVRDGFAAKAGNTDFASLAHGAEHRAGIVAAVIKPGPHISAPLCGQVDGALLPALAMDHDGALLRLEVLGIQPGELSAP